MQSESFFGLSAGHGLRPLKGCGKEELLSGRTAVGWAPQQTFTGSSHPWNLVSSFLSEEQSSPEQKVGRGSWLVSDVPFPHTRSVPGFCAAL